MKEGTPATRLPKPAWEPHMTSRVLPSASVSSALLYSMELVVAENLSTNEFIVTGDEEGDSG